MLDRDERGDRRRRDLVGIDQPRIPSSGSLVPVTSRFILASEDLDRDVPSSSSVLMSSVLTPHVLEESREVSVTGGIERS